MADHVRLLGVTLENRQSMDKHVNEVSRTCFYYLRALRHIRPCSHHCRRCKHDCLLSRRLAARLRQRCVAWNIINASNMRWLDAYWTRKLIVARMRCYINYTDCLSVIVWTLNLRNSRSSFVHLLLALTLIH